MALPTSFNPNQPIPNNPFYSLESYIIQAAYSPFIVGAGLSVDSEGVITSSGGGGGAVTSIIAGTGINVSGGTGNVTVSNAGVTSIIAGANVAVSGGTGAVTISVVETGTVSLISTGTGLTGGPITTFGTINLANTSVTPGTYTNASIIVDAQGRITGASNGTALGSVVGTAPINVSTVANVATVSINAASTTQAGAVQLLDSVTSTSISQAATPNAVKTAFDAAAAAIPKACITGKGALISGTGASIPAPLAVGTNGQVLTADSTCATGLKWAAGGGGSVSNATPTSAGIVLGCTTADNAALGCNALLVNTTGSCNTALGINALTTNTIGSYNTATGSCSLTANLGGSYNTATGVCSLASNTNGIENTAVGFSSLGSNLTGFGNTAVGVSSLTSNTSGRSNSSLGSYSLNRNTTGNCNVAIGGESLLFNTTGSYNTAVGSAAMFRNTTGCYNTAVGNNVFNSNTTGSLNNSYGQGALGANTTGDCNNAYGFGALGTSDSGCNNTAIGTSSMKCNLTGNYNTAIGDLSAYNVTSGCNNVGVGRQAGYNLTTGSNNVAIGPLVEFPSITGNCQLVIGSNKDAYWLTGDSTLAIKPGAGIIDNANSCGTANYVLTSQGNAVQWKPVNSGIGVPNYGSFYTIATQTLATANTPQPVELLSTGGARGFFINNNSEIVGPGGLYNVQFSLQLYVNPGGGGDFEVWLAIGGTPVSDSNTRFAVKNSNEAECASLNYIVNLPAGQYIQLYWASDDTNNILYGTTSLFGGPDIPSAIVTVTPVGA